MRFTIRDLLWLMVVVALGVGWWSNYVALRDERRHREYLEQAIDNAGFVPDGDYLGPTLLSKQHRADLRRKQAEAKNRLKK